jgi:hypothetical protein
VDQHGGLPAGPWESPAPEVVNLMQNYAVFLKKIGRHYETDAFKTRVAMA